MSLNYNKATDDEHEIKLDSELISASWVCSRAVAGAGATLEVITQFVGERSPIKIIVRGEIEGKIEKIKSYIRRNKFIRRVEIPADIELDDQVYFEVKLSKCGLKGESNRIPAAPPIRVVNLKWSSDEARRGDTVTLTADVSGARSGDEAIITIWEHDKDGVHDRICELPATVKDDKIELRWEYEYHEDTDEIPTHEELEPGGNPYNHPEYFFTVKIGGAEFGKEGDPKLLRFKDWIDITLDDDLGRNLEGTKYILHLPDNECREGTLDAKGNARVEDVPPGKYRVEFPDMKGVRKR